MGNTFCACLDGPPSTPPYKLTLDLCRTSISVDIAYDITEHTQKTVQWLHQQTNLICEAFDLHPQPQMISLPRRRGIIEAPDAELAVPSNKPLSHLFPEKGPKPTLEIFDAEKDVEVSPSNKEGWIRFFKDDKRVKEIVWSQDDALDQKLRLFFLKRDPSARIYRNPARPRHWRIYYPSAQELLV